MKKKLITLAFLAGLLFSGLLGLSQTLVPQVMSGPSSLSIFKGQLEVDKAILMPQNDTTFTPIKAGAIIYKIADGRYYTYNGSFWEPFVKSSDLSLKLNITDTFPMLLRYLRASDTTGKWMPKNIPYVVSLNGKTGVVVAKSADSITNLPVDTSIRRNGYFLAFDSLNRKWYLSAGGGGGGGSGVSSIGLLSPSGDISVTGSPLTSAGNITLALPVQGSLTPGTFGDASHVGAITLNSKGIATGGSQISIQITESQVTSLSSDLAGKFPNPIGTTSQYLRGDGSLATYGTLTYSQGATNNTISLGNTQIFLVADVNHAGLFDTAAKRLSDSIRLHQIGNLNYVTSLGGRFLGNRTSSIGGFKWTLDSAALTINKIDSTPIQIYQVKSSSNQIMTRMWPYYYNTDPTYKPFDQTIEVTSDGGGLYNNVYKWGWNPGRSYNPLIGGFHDAMEGNYHPGGGAIFFERHIGVVSYEDGNETRSASLTHNHHTTAYTSPSSWYFHGDSYDFRNWTSGNNPDTSMLTFSYNKSNKSASYNLYTDYSSVSGQGGLAIGPEFGVTTHNGILLSAIGNWSDYLHFAFKDINISGQTGPSYATFDYGTGSLNVTRSIATDSLFSNSLWFVSSRGIYMDNQKYIWAPGAGNNLIVGGAAPSINNTGVAIGNIIIGKNTTGQSISTAKSDLILGWSAGGGLTTGGNNVILGNAALQQSPATTHHSIIIGDSSAYNGNAIASILTDGTLNYKLWIDDSSRADKPLIYGEFNNRVIGINSINNTATLNVGGSIWASGIDSTGTGTVINVLYQGTDGKFHKGAPAGGSTYFIGPIDSLSKVANGLQIVSNKIIAQTADASHPGMITGPYWAYLDSLKRNLIGQNLYLGGQATGVRMMYQLGDTLISKNAINGKYLNYSNNNDSTWNYNLDTANLHTWITGLTLPTPYYVYGVGGTSGVTGTIPNGVNYFLINQTIPSTITGCTITMPSSPVDGQVVRISTISLINGFSVVGNTGQGIMLPPSTITLTPGLSVGFVWKSSVSTWYKINDETIGSGGSYLPLTLGNNTTINQAGFSLTANGDVNVGGNLTQTGPYIKAKTYLTTTSTVNSTGTFTLDLSASNLVVVNLVANITSWTTITTGPGSGTYIVEFVQDATGGRTVAWPSSIHWAGGSAPTITSTANKRDIVTLVWDSGAGGFWGSIIQNF